MPSDGLICRSSAGHPLQLNKSVALQQARTTRTTYVLVENVFLVRIQSSDQPVEQVCEWNECITRTRVATVNCSSNALERLHGHCKGQC